MNTDTIKQMTNTEKSDIVAEYDLRQHTIIYALRYALPRPTGAFLQVQAYILSIAGELSQKCKADIINTLKAEKYEIEHESLRLELLQALEVAI